MQMVSFLLWFCCNNRAFIVYFFVPFCLPYFLINLHIFPQLKNRQLSLRFKAIQEQTNVTFS